jgi:hypothetical protein
LHDEQIRARIVFKETAFTFFIKLVCGKPDEEISKTYFYRRK